MWRIILSVCSYSATSPCRNGTAPPSKETEDASLVEAAVSLIESCKREIERQRNNYLCTSQGISCYLGSCYEIDKPLHCWPHLYQTFFSILNLIFAHCYRRPFAIADSRALAPFVGRSVCYSRADALQCVARMSPARSAPADCARAGPDNVVHRTNADEIGKNISVEPS